MTTSRILPLLGALAALACRTEPPRKAQSASAYTADSAGAAREDGVAGTTSGASLQAPPLLAPMRLTLQTLPRQSGEQLKANLTNYKNQMGDLISAMQADLVRAGYPDTGSFRALSDSVLDDIGGGTGLAEGPGRDQLNLHIARAQRLIGQYEQAMRTAKK